MSDIQSKNINVTVINSGMGYAVYVDDYRVAGSKPFGGGAPHTYKTNVKELMSAIPELRKMAKENESLKEEVESLRKQLNECDEHVQMLEAGEDI